MPAASWLWLAALLAPAGGGLGLAPAPGRGTAWLPTPWTSNVSAAAPRPEHPRPQMERRDWLSLNGVWQYWGGPGAPNAQAAGRVPPKFPAKVEEILVPFPPEAPLSGIHRQRETHMWYKRALRLPKGWGSRRVLLNFAAVDRITTVYIDDTQVGSHFGGYTSFNFDITSLLGDGPADLIVAAFDPTDDDGASGKQQRDPDDIWHTACSGIWQSVWLEAVDELRVERLFLTPNLPLQRLQVRAVSTAMASEAAVLEVVVYDGAWVVANTSASIHKELSIFIPDPHPWSPEDPFLYTYRARVLKRGRPKDEVSGYFGLRQLELRPVDGVLRPLLNGRFIVQRGVLDQGYWPDGLYTAPTDDALRFDVQQAKAMGFNMIRKHVKLEPARWYYWADRLGVLVWQDLPNMRSREVRMRPIYQGEVRSMIEERINHPSIVTWVLFNEGWGMFDPPGNLRLVKDIDSTRWVTVNSGGSPVPEAAQIGDFAAIHQFPGPACPEGKPHQALALGQAGGFGLNATGHTWRAGRGVARAPQWCDDGAALGARYAEHARLLGPLVTQAGLSAFVYHQLADVEAELDGLLTYDRQVVKVEASTVRLANEALGRKGQPAPPAKLRVHAAATARQPESSSIWVTALVGVCVVSGFLCFARLWCRRREVRGSSQAPIGGSSWGRDHSAVRFQPAAAGRRHGSHSSNPFQ